MMGRVLEGTFLEGAGMAESPAQGRKGGPAAPQLRLDELLEGLQAQVEQVRATRDRVHTLLDAVLSIGTDLDLDVVLRRITESAVTLVDAQYGALGVLGEEGKIRQFITVGMDESTIEEIGHYPEGKGILGLLIREPEPLRLPDLGRHHDSVGFPAGHPPMTTFLGAPVRVRDQVFGNLYLTDKRGGAEFDDDDEAVLRTLAAAAGVAIDNARLYENSRRREQWLAASSDLTRSLLSGTDPDQVLYKVASTVRALSGADLVTLAVPFEGGDELVIEAADGEGAEQVHGLVLPATTLAAEVYRSNERITSSALSDEPQAGGGSAGKIGLGPGFLLPLGGGEHVLGVLQAANLTGGTEFSEATMAMISSFADQAAAVLGFTPALRMTGLLDTDVPSDHAEHLLAVLRETLSNAARHAHATTVEVTAETDGSRLHLRVADNGTGVDPAVTRRSGLDNLRQRATDLGGSFTLKPNDPTGTIVEWTVPLSVQAEA